ncbi:MAG TPA: hypothetical protein PKX75_19365, partial [Nitrospira sp.]|nr:hypothetical protein [Nitrospira sp.]HNK51207.1 hypothetical protein [Nitrospira sp.]
CPPYSQAAQRAHHAGVDLIKLSLILNAARRTMGQTVHCAKRPNASTVAAILQPREAPYER